MAPQDAVSRLFFFPNFSKTLSEQIVVYHLALTVFVVQWDLADSTLKKKERNHLVASVSHLPQFCWGAVTFTEGFCFLSKM